MNVGDFLNKLRNPKEALKTAIVTIALATLSIVGTQIAIGLWNVVLARLEFPMVAVQIEALRDDLSRIPCQAIPMVAAQATQTNQRIAYSQEANRHRYSDWMVIDDWARIPRLEMPCGKAVD